MKIPGKVSSPPQKTCGGDVLIGRIQTNPDKDHPLAVAGADATGSINFS
jgi:hypothetical protein